MRTVVQNIKKKYFYTDYQRAVNSTHATLLINLTIGIVKFALGLYYMSFWFMIIAGYYIILGIIKKWIVQKTKNDYHQTHQMKLYHQCGILIIILGIFYMGMCIWMYFFNETISYPEYILYGVAAVAFYKIGLSSKGLWMARQQQGMLFQELKVIGFLDACVSIVAVQCALLSSQNSPSASSSSALLGIAVSIMFLFIGIWMLNKKTKT